eukprot:SM000139S00115  [mRNA]  locus=s139:130100:130651:- [translate_table: standard]
MSKGDKPTFQDPLGRRITHLRVSGGIINREDRLTILGRYFTEAAADVYRRQKDSVLNMTRPIPDNATDVQRALGPQLIEDTVGEMLSRMARHFPINTSMYKQALMRFSRTQDESITACYYRFKNLIVGSRGKCLVGGGLSESFAGGGVSQPNSQLTLPLRRTLKVHL